MMATAFGHMNKTSLFAVFCTFCHSSYVFEYHVNYFELTDPVSASQQDLCFGVMREVATKM